MKKPNKKFFFKVITSSYLQHLKLYKKPNYIYFNLKKIVAGDYERYKIYEKPVIVPYNAGYTGERGKAKNPEKSLRESLARAKQKIFGYVMANCWEYWATQTFNSSKLDRFNLDEIVKKYNRRLLYLKSKYKKLQWLIVPEQHKNEAWHLHMLISGIPENKIVYSGYDYYNKNKNFSRRIFNWIDTVDFGFNDYVFIKNIDALEQYKIAVYLTKYITKDLAVNRFNKKLYWVSKGLKQPLIKNYLIKNIEEFNFKSNQIVLTENTYCIKNDVGEIINKVEDFTVYKPIPF